MVRNQPKIMDNSSSLWTNGKGKKGEDFILNDIVKQAKRR